MTIKEKMLKIITLAMSIEPTGSKYLSVDWDNNTKTLHIWIHAHANGSSIAVLEHLEYDGSRTYSSYKSMINRLNRLKKEWSEENKNVR